MADTKRPWLSTLAWFGMTINGHLEDGQHGVTFEDVYEGLNEGTLFDMLKSKVPHVDVTMWTKVNPDQGSAVIAALRDASGGMRDREERKYGISKGGLSLLVTYVLEAMQQQYWEPPAKR